MFTPAMTASRTSLPEVIILKALATQVRPSSSFDLLPLADEITTGLTAPLAGTCGASPRASRFRPGQRAHSGSCNTAATAKLLFHRSHFSLLLLRRRKGAARFGNVSRNGAFMTFTVDSFHSEHLLIDRCILERELTHVSCPDFPFPIRGRRRPNHDDKSSQVRLRVRLFPAQDRIVTRTPTQPRATPACRIGSLRNWRFRSERQRGGGGGVDSGHPCGITRGRIGEAVCRRMLVVEIFVRGRKADRGIAFLVERGVISAAAKTIVAKNHVHRHLRK